MIRVSKKELGRERGAAESLDEMNDSEAEFRPYTKSSETGRAALLQMSSYFSLDFNSSKGEGHAKIVFEMHCACFLTVFIRL